MEDTRPRSLVRIWSLR